MSKLSLKKESITKQAKLLHGSSVPRFCIWSYLTIPGYLAAGVEHNIRCEHTEVKHPVTLNLAAFSHSVPATVVQYRTFLPIHLEQLICAYLRKNKQTKSPIC